jgi:plastocyanin
MEKIMIGKIVLLGTTVAVGLLFATFAILSQYSAAQTAGYDNSKKAPLVKDSSMGQNMRETGVTNGNNIMMKDNNNNSSGSPGFLFKLENKYHKYENGVFIVRAGGGAAIAPLTWFFPKHAEIKAGETVMWVNPTRVGEPHTITFMNDENLHTDFAAPFVFANGGGNSNSNSGGANLTSAIPNANAEPIVMPGPNGSSIVIGINNNSISPTIINAAGNMTHLAPNANYTMDGTEKYVNSGWIWPQGQVPPGLPPINSFSVKFTKAGTYSYMCEVHPWMTGEVVVK